MKKIVNFADVKDQALQTISEVAELVKRTLGPGGNPIILQRLGQNPDGTPLYPLITKDGVSVAESITFRDPTKNTIAQAMLQVAKNTVNSAGDGTTTAIVLAEAIYKAGYIHLKQGVNGIALYNELNQVKDRVIAELNKIVVKISAIEQVRSVANISANGDAEIAGIVAEAIEAVGEDGYVRIEEGDSKETKLEQIQGTMYKEGWRNFSPHGSLLVTDKSRDVCELRRPAVLMYAGKLDTVHEVAELIYRTMGQDPETKELKNIIPMLFIAHDFSDDVKNFIVQNRVQGKLPIAGIKSPVDGTINSRTRILEDLAVLLGGTVAARGIIDLKDVTDEHLGCAELVEIKPQEIVFYDGMGEKAAVMEHLEELKKLLQEATNDYDREKIRIRMGKLSGGIAVIRAGGSSELEMLEKKDRIEDALCAARVAIQEGILPGGGSALYEIAIRMSGNSLAEVIMREALQAPIKQIIANIGRNPEVVLSHMPAGLGFDARKVEYRPMLDAGIVDPLKVTRSALENAVSIVGLLLTTGGAVVLDTSSKDGTPNPLAGLLG